MTDTVPTKELELTYAEAAELGFRLHTQRRFSESEGIYRSLLRANPDDPNVLHYLGVLLFQTGRRDEAVPLIERSIDIDGGVAAWHNNYGNVLLQAERFDAAADAYGRCVELDLSNVEVLCNSGILYRCLKRYEEAEVALTRALAAQPDFINAHLNLATLYWEMGRIEDAYAQAASALTLYPRDANVRRLLGFAYARAGRLEDAANVYREWLALEPRSEAARHHLAGCTGIDVPDRAEGSHVEREFDGFASSFDAKLTALQYRAPQLVGEAAARWRPDSDKNLRILDAGCGTGLCAPHLVRLANELVGVDLSTNMLELARVRGLYNDLVKSELVAYLDAVSSPFDVVVSADTLCYFGRLDAFAQGARRALCDSGLLVFTVEASNDEADYRLHPHGRYSHCPHYVKATLEDAGFAMREQTDVVLRNEGGLPVSGLVVVAEAMPL